MSTIIERLDDLMAKAGDGFVIVSADFLAEVAYEIERLQKALNIRDHDHPPVYAERNDEIVKLCKAGVSRAEIARKFGLGEGRIRQIERRAGVNLVTDQRLAWLQRNIEIMALLEQGVKMAEVARRYGMSASRVREIKLGNRRD